MFNIFAWYSSWAVKNGLIHICITVLIIEKIRCGLDGCDWKTACKCCVFITHHSAPDVTGSIWNSRADRGNEQRSCCPPNLPLPSTTHCFEKLGGWRTLAHLKECFLLFFSIILWLEINPYSVVLNKTRKSKFSHTRDRVAGSSNLSLISFSRIWRGST